MVSTERHIEPGEQQKEERESAVITHLDDIYSTVCPGCGGTLDFWACEALCHYCGLKFTCDE